MSYFKISSSIALALASLLVLLTACSSIAEDERFIYTPLTSNARAVLIEDFTGQRCVNCPNAALEIENLKQQYGADTIIAVGIHSGPLAVFSRGNVLGLRTAEGDAYYDHWQVQQEPMGYINRRGALATVDLWGTLVREAVQMSTDLHIKLKATYDSVANVVKIHSEVINGEPVEGKLQLWITENNIKALQMMPDGSANPDYIHQHVFRTSVNGSWGTPFVAAQGEVIEQQFECTPDEAWQLQNISVVAFIYDDSGVLQVAECAVDSK